VEKGLLPDDAGLGVAEEGLGRGFERGLGSLNAEKFGLADFNSFEIEGMRTRGVEF